MFCSQTITIDKIKYLSDEQLSILDAIIDEFLKTSTKPDVSKRIGVAKGKITVPANFDEIDFETPEFFGIES